MHDKRLLLDSLKVWAPVERLALGMLPSHGIREFVSRRPAPKSFGSQSALPVVIL
jgi:hypothetical protein